MTNPHPFKSEKMQTVTVTTDQQLEKWQTQFERTRLRSMLDKLEQRINPGFPITFKDGMKLYDGEMSMINNAIFDANKYLLTPATADEIADQFSLLSGGMRLPKDMDSTSAAQAYTIALSGISSFAIRQSVFLIIRGKAEGFNKTFMPTAPELAAFCRKLEENEWENIKGAERLIKAAYEQNARDANRQ